MNPKRKKCDDRVSPWEVVLELPIVIAQLDSFPRLYRRQRLAVAMLLTLIHCRNQSGDTAPRLEKPESYTSAPVRLIIADAATGQPLDGAVVVAVWRKIRNYDGRWNGIFRTSEKVTDSRGEVVIPRWGPRPVDGFSYLDSRDPEFWIIKRGYLPAYYDNDGASNPLASPSGAPARVSKRSPNESTEFKPGMYMASAEMRSRWDGQRVELYIAQSPETAARCLEVAAPLDRYEAVAVQNQLPLYWKEWSAARDALGPAWSNRVEQPLPLMQKQPSDPARQD